MATVNLKVQLDPSGAIKGLELVGAGTRKTGKEVGALQSLLQGVGQGFGQQLYSGLTRVAGGLLGVTSAAAEYAGKFQDLSDRTGQGVEALQKYEFAAKAVGTSVEAVAGAGTKLAKNLYDGTEDSVKAVGRLGLSWQNLRNQTPDKQLESVLGAISKLPNPTERSAIAMQLLGKGAAPLIPLGGQLAELSARAEQLGLVLDTKTVAALDDLGDEVGAMAATWEGFKNQIGGVIASSEPLHVLIVGLTDLMGALSGRVKDNRDGMRSLVDEGVVRLAGALVGLMDVAQFGLNVWENLNRGWLKFQETGFNLGAAIADLGAIQTRVFAGPIASKWFKEQARDFRGMAQASRDLAAEELRTGAKRADALGLARGALANLKKEVEASVGKHHEAAAAADRHAGGLTNTGKAAEAAAEKLEKARQAAEKWAREQVSKEAEESQKGLLKGLKEIEEEEERIAAARRKRTDDRIAQWEEEKREEEAELARQKELLGLVHELAGAVFDLGDAFGGALGGGLRFGAGVIDVFASVNEWAIRAQESTDKTALALQRAGAVAQGAAAAFKSGSFFGGAFAGASAGAAFGPIGAGIGAVAGGLLGLFGKSKKAREEVEKLRAEISKTYGSMEAAKEAAQRLGLNLDKAFDSKKPKEVKAAMEQLAKAIEDQKKRIEGLNSAFEGLTLRSMGFQEQLDRGAVSTEQLDRYAGQAFATFQAWLEETGDLRGALERLGPTLDAIAAAQDELGVAASGGIQALLHIRDVIEANQDVADSLGGINQTMKGLKDSGFLTKELFLSFGKDAAEQFGILQGRGVDANTALTLMQPTLQQLWEGQKRFGNITDEATKGLLDQAEAQGLVGAQFQSVADKQLDVLLLIAETLGATIPDSMKRMGDAAEKEFGRVGKAASDAGNVLPFPGGGGGGDYSGEGGPAGEGFGRGGFLGRAARGMIVPPRRGGWAVVGEAGQAEVVAPVAALFGTLGRQMAAQVAAAVSNGSGTPTVVQLVLDGKIIDERIIGTASRAALSNQGSYATAHLEGLRRRGLKAG